jgi:hypothetical protein
MLYSNSLIASAVATLPLHLLSYVVMVDNYVYLILEYNFTETRSHTPTTASLFMAVCKFFLRTYPTATPSGASRLSAYVRLL